MKQHAEYLDKLCDAYSRYLTVPNQVFNMVNYNLAFLRSYISLHFYRKYWLHCHANIKGNTTLQAVSDDLTYGKGTEII